MYHAHVELLMREIIAITILRKYFLKTRQKDQITLEYDNVLMSNQFIIYGKQVKVGQC